MQASEQRTQFDYLLNAMENAAREAHPAKAGYAGKRKAVFAYVRDLEKRALSDSEAREIIKEPTDSQMMDWLEAAYTNGAFDGVAWRKLMTDVAQRGYRAAIRAAMENKNG